MDVSVQESPNSQAFPVGRNSKALEPWGYSVSDFFAPGLDLGSSGAKQWRRCSKTHMEIKDIQGCHGSRRRNCFLEANAYWQGVCPATQGLNT